MPPCSFDESDDECGFEYYEEQERQILAEKKIQASPAKSSASSSGDLVESPPKTAEETKAEKEAAEQAAAEVADLEALMESVSDAARHAELTMSGSPARNKRDAEVVATEETDGSQLVDSPILPVRDAKRKADEVTEETPKKRRLNGKQATSPKTEKKPRPVRKITFSEDVDYEKTTFEEFKNWAENAERDEKYDQYMKNLKMYGFNVCRNKWVAEMLKDKRPRNAEKTLEARTALRKDFTSLAEELKKEFAREIKDRKGFLSKKETYGISIRFELDINLKTEEDKDEESSEVKFIDAAFCMLTYFSPKWNLTRAPWGPMDDIARFEELCQKDKYVIRIKNQVHEDVERLKTELFVSKAAYSLELCPEKFKENELQIHVTVVFKWNHKARYRSSDPFKLLGIEPQHVKAQKRKKEMRRADTPEPMFYYVQCPKDGMLFHDSNYKPFKDFPVNDKWLNPFLQNKKIRVANAIQDLPVGIQSDKSRKRVDQQSD